MTSTHIWGGGAHAPNASPPLPTGVRGLWLKVIDQKPQYLEMAGNLIPVAKTDDQLNVVFRAFSECRLAFLVRIRDPAREPTARLSFMREPRAQTPRRRQTPVCSVVVTLPELTPDVDTKTCQCRAHLLIYQYTN